MQHVPVRIQLARMSVSMSRSLKCCWVAVSEEESSKAETAFVDHSHRSLSVNLMEYSALKVCKTRSSMAILSCRCETSDGLRQTPFDREASHLCL